MKIQAIKAGAGSITRTKLHALYGHDLQNEIVTAIESLEKLYGGVSREDSIERVIGNAILKLHEYRIEVSEA